MIECYVFLRNRIVQPQKKPDGAKDGHYYLTGGIPNDICTRMDISNDKFTRMEIPNDKCMSMEIPHVTAYH